MTQEQLDFQNFWRPLSAQERYRFLVRAAARQDLSVMNLWRELRNGGKV